MTPPDEALRIAAAGGVALAYAGLCAATWRAHRARHARAAATLRPTPEGTRPVLVVHGSQTGTAEQIAWQTARALDGAGVAARVVDLARLQPDELQAAARALFIVSTYGEGDPPDAAAGFARRVMSAELALGGLHCGLLALGDRSYRHYCGFGRTLDGWLRQRGAQPLFERIDVDRGDVAALQRWQQQLARLSGSESLDWAPAAAFEPWRLVARRQLNPGSAGGPCFHLELEPPGAATLPHWEAGDLAQVLAPGDAERPRDYSIASLPADGRLHLLVRQERHADGGLGLASGWLSVHAAIGDPVPLRLREHPGFRLGDNAQRPLLLIGNGSGIAGLRAHLKARAAAAAGPNWLVYGERNAAHDTLYGDEVEAWRAAGVLARVDRVYSRDGAACRYVQDRLRECADELHAWLAQGAAVYVCGSLAGMASGVEAALVEIAGADRLAQLREAGRYRRDVY